LGLTYAGLGFLLSFNAPVDELLWGIHFHAEGSMTLIAVAILVYGWALSVSEWFHNIYHLS